MAIDVGAFFFIITLAGVINGLGIVEWIAGVGRFLKHSRTLTVEGYWVFYVQAACQFLLHILLWWSLWGIREVADFNFLTYIYLLAGPVLLYLGTSLLTPDVGADASTSVIDLGRGYFESRRSYYSVLALLWLWVIMLWPILAGVFSPGLPLFTVFLAIAVALRATAWHQLHAVLVPLQAALLVAFIALFAMELGGIGRTITERL